MIPEPVSVIFYVCLGAVSSLVGMGVLLAGWRLTADRREPCGGMTAAGVCARRYGHKGDCR